MAMLDFSTTGGRGVSTIFPPYFLCLLNKTENSVFASLNNLIEGLTMKSMSRIGRTITDLGFGTSKETFFIRIKDIKKNLGFYQQIFAREMVNPPPTYL